jgi:hypothetical protein
MATDSKQEWDEIVECFSETAKTLALSAPLIAHHTHILSSVVYTGDNLGVFFSIERMVFYLQVYIFPSHNGSIPSSYDEGYVQKQFIDVQDAVRTVSNPDNADLLEYDRLLQMLDQRQCGNVVNILSRMLPKYWTKLVDRYGYRPNITTPSS